MKVVRKVQVKNAMGLHTRPATTIVQLLQNSLCDVTFTYRQDTVNAKSILSLLMLAATKNSKITIAVEGEEADLVMNKLVDAFENQFGE